jgi:hypothetical protein
MRLGVQRFRFATGNSFDEMMRNFESQRDAEFSSHV